MKTVKCFDVVNSVVEEAMNQLSKLWVLDLERLDILKQYCGVIDSVVDEFEGDSFEVEIDDITLEVHIEFACKRIEFNKKNRILLKLIGRSVSTQIKTTDDGMLALHFMFPSL